MLRGQSILRLSSHCGSPGVQPDKGNANQQRNEKQGTVFSSASKHFPGESRQIAGEEFQEIAGEAQGVKAAGDNIGEPEHPASDESDSSGEGHSDIGVPPSGPWNRRGEFGVSKGSQQRDDTIQSESQNGRGACLPGSDSGQYENAGADHGTHPNHSGFKEPQVASKSNFTCLVFLTGLIHGARDVKEEKRAQRARGPSSPRCPCPAGEVGIEMKCQRRG